LFYGGDNYSDAGGLIAPVVSRMLRFFPPVVTGTIIAVIGISLMRVGINWIFGNPFGPTAPKMVNPEHAKWLADVSMAAGCAPGSGTLRPPRWCPKVPKGLSWWHGAQPQVRHAAGHRHCGVGAGVHPADCQVRQGLCQANISVLLGIVIGGCGRHGLG
jgi:hypothetical protein